MSDTSAPIRGKWRAALWAGLLSLVFPGLGQIYAGAWRLGITLYVFVEGFAILGLMVTWTVPPTSYPVAAFALAIFIFSILRLGIAFDAARRVRRHSAPRTTPWYQSTWLAGTVMFGIAAGYAVGVIPPPQAGWRNFSIPSQSNMPTLLVGDYVMTDVRQPGAMPTYGDMAVFHLPRNPDVDYIKRVVGLSGDRVQIKQGTLYLNGNAIERRTTGGRSGSLLQYKETMPNGPTYSILVTSDNEPGSNTGEYTVPPGHFFVLGDNRNNSLDSRQQDFGYVPATHVVGLAHTIVWSRDLPRLLSRIE